MDYKFYLEFVNTDEGILIEINEPTNWSDIHLIVKTPKRKLFGRNFSFSNGEVSLQFDSDFDTNDKGHQFNRLVDYAKTYGAGAIVRFHYKECDTTFFLGELNYKAFETDKCTFFKTNIIQEQKSNVILENYDISADLNGTTTLNNDVGGVLLDKKDFILKGKEIVQTARQGIDGGSDSYYQVLRNITWSKTQNGSKYTKQPLFNLDISRDVDIQNNLWDTVNLPLSSFNYAFGEGFTDVTAEINMTLDVATANGTVDFDDIKYKVYALLRDAEGADTQSELLLNITSIPPSGSWFENAENPSDDGITDAEFTRYNINSSIIFNNVSAGSTITIYARPYANPEFRLNKKRIHFWTRILDTSTFTVTGGSTREPTEHNIPLLKDVIDKVVDYISDGDVALSMPEFEIGQEYYEHFTTNGYEVRKSVDERQFTLSLKDAINNLNSLFVVGYQVDMDNILIGTVKEFYKPINMGLLDYPITSYTEKLDKELLINQFKFKYADIPKDKNNTLDEFNTKSEYYIPSDKVNGKINLTSDFIASGYILEQERRKQFSDAETISGEHDDKIFIIDSVFSGGKWTNRTNDNISNIDNLISPSTAYNISLNPLQILSRWWYYVGSALHYLNKSDIIKTTFFENNEFMQCKINDSSTLSTTQTQKSTYDKSIFKTPIFEPLSVDVELVNMPMSKFMSLKNDIMQVRGFNQVNNKIGEVIDLFILDLDYSPVTEKLIIKGIKKNNAYV